MGLIYNILSAIDTWITGAILTILLFVVEIIVGLLHTFFIFFTMWIFGQIVESSSGWMDMPLIQNLFGMAHSIGLALFFVGVLYTVMENLLNYNREQGMASFKSVIKSVSFGFLAVQTFHLAVPMLYQWSVSLTVAMASVGTDIGAVMSEISGRWVLLNADDFVFLVNPIFETSTEALIAILNEIFSLINIAFIAWGIYRLVLSLMQRLGTVVILTMRMSFTFFSFARGMSDSFTKAAMDMLGLHVIMFLQMYLVMTAIFHSHLNPLMVWGLIIVSTKIDSILQFGMDTASRTSGQSLLAAATKLKFLGAFSRGGKNTIGGSIS